MNRNEAAKLEPGQVVALQAAALGSSREHDAVGVVVEALRPVTVTLHRPRHRWTSREPIEVEAPAVRVRIIELRWHGIDFLLPGSRGRDEGTQRVQVGAEADVPPRTITARLADTLDKYQAAQGKEAEADAARAEREARRAQLIADLGHSEFATTLTLTAGELAEALADLPDCDPVRLHLLYTPDKLLAALADRRNVRQNRAAVAQLTARHLTEEER